MTSNALFTRRRFAALLGAGVPTLMAGCADTPSYVRQYYQTGEQRPPKVVIVGGGHAGAGAAATLRRVAPAMEVTLVAGERPYVTPVMSNSVLTGLMSARPLMHDFGPLARMGVTVVPQAATTVDESAPVVRLADGTQLPYDFLIMAPGIALDGRTIEGWGRGAAERMPHAWTSVAPQLDLLRRQLQAMDDGGLVVLTLPAGHQRLPLAQYERATLIARWLQAHKPRAKVMLLDAEADRSGAALFEHVWRELFPGRVERVAGPAGRVTAVAPDAMTLTTSTGQRHTAAVASVVPPQRAALICAQAGLAAPTGWCPVDPQTFQARGRPAVQVVGDSADVAPLPKSATIATNAGGVAASVLVQRLQGQRPESPILIHNYYALAGRDYGLSWAGVYDLHPSGYLPVPGSEAESPLTAPESWRRREADNARGAFASLTAQTWGDQ